MPMYDYVCKDCGEEFVVLCNYNDYEQRCTECESINTERKLSAPHGTVARRPYDML